jgi:UDP-N-acetylglucosamine kinase
MIIESSLKSPHTAIENGTILTPRGYKVELAVMATPKEESWKGTIDRYNSQKEMGLQPRAVPKEFHDLVVSNISDSISQVYKSGLMSNILIYNRNKECLYDMSKTPKINPNNLLEKAIHGVKKEFYYLIATPEEVAELEKSNIQFDKKANESGFIVRCDKKDKEAIEDVLGQSKGLSK